MGIYLKGLEHYPALVRREGDFYQADFVDLPGCRAYGASAVEAEINAVEALGEHAATLSRHGRILPNPSVVEQRDRSDERYVAYISAPLP
jgi:predicted RNase H-like HicB family nuclease